MCKSIFGITTINFVTQLNRDNKEQSLYRLFDTCGVCLGKTMKNRSSMWGAITAISGTSCAITFDLILPMQSKNNSIQRFLYRGTIHAKRMKLIKLSCFTSFPKGPSVKTFQLSLSEAPKRLLGWSWGLGSYCLDSYSGFFKQIVIGIKVNMWFKIAAIECMSNMDMVGTCLSS